MHLREVLKSASPGTPGSEKPNIRGGVRAFLVALTVAGFTVGAGAIAAQAASIPIYSNPLKSSKQRAAINQYGTKANCSRLQSKEAFRFRLGKSTRECFYRIPVVGKSIAVSARGFLSTETPRSIRGRTWLAVSTRQATDGSRYQLVVFPVQQKVQLRKVKANGDIEILAVETNVSKVGKPGKPNRMTLQAFDETGSLVKLGAWVNGKRIALVDDPQGAQMTGRYSTFSIGSSAPANKATGSFRNLSIRIPDPL